MEQYAIVFQVLLVLLVLFFGFITYMGGPARSTIQATPSLVSSFPFGVMLPFAPAFTAERGPLPIPPPEPT